MGDANRPSHEEVARSLLRWPRVEAGSPPSCPSIVLWSFGEDAFRADGKTRSDSSDRRNARFEAAAIVEDIVEGKQRELYANTHVKHMTRCSS